MARTSFSGPVRSLNGFEGDLTGAVTLDTFTTANAPSASDAGAGSVIFVSDGAGGGPILAFSDGTDWLRSDTGAAISDS